MEENSQRELLEQRKKRIFSLRSFIFLVICIAILAFLYSIFDQESLEKIILKINPLYLLAASFLYFLSNLLKTFRFQIFFKEQKLNMPKLFTVVSYHNFFNQIMPARTGEITLVYYLRSICKVDISKGVHSLIIVRFMDLFIVAVFFIISFILLQAETVSPALLIAAIAVGILALGVILFVDKFMVFASQFFHHFFKITRLIKIRFIQKVEAKLNEFAETFSTESANSKIPMLLVSSVLIWIVLYLLSYTIIIAFGVNINILRSTLGATAQVLTNVLPVNSFGSFGTMEAGWVGGYVLVGVEKNVAIISAFAYHLVVFFTAAFLALLSFIVFKITQKKN
jgi:uncharacterized protein (TIRG00374 family)